MTQHEVPGASSRKTNRCAWCGSAFASGSGPGRPARYCRRSHRQRAYEARRLAEARRLDADEVLVSRNELQRVRDLVFRLEAALDDAVTDLDDGADLDAVYGMVVSAARAVVAGPLEPLATHD